MSPPENEPSAPPACPHSPVLELQLAAIVWLANGRYTGFSEQELKQGGAEQAEQRLQQRDMSSFGEAKDDLNETTTSAFVILLILFPSVCPHSPMGARLQCLRWEWF